jgi:hypothetical protein
MEIREFRLGVWPARVPQTGAEQAITFLVMQFEPGGAQFRSKNPKRQTKEPSWKFTFPWQPKLRPTRDIAGSIRIGVQMQPARFCNLRAPLCSRDNRGGMLPLAVPRFINPRVGFLRLLICTLFGKALHEIDDAPAHLRICDTHNGDRQPKAFVVGEKIRCGRYRPLIAADGSPIDVFKEILDRHVQYCVTLCNRPALTRFVPFSYF